MPQARKVEGYEDVEEAEYCYFKIDGDWYLWIPDAGLASLHGHKVTEHEDGTISASPSILLEGWIGGLPEDGGHKGYAHGFLEHSAWRDC